MEAECKNSAALIRLLLQEKCDLDLHSLLTPVCLNMINFHFMGNGHKKEYLHFTFIIIIYRQTTETLKL